ncbi:Murein DD-endopeptidase MepM and murein hydrolase activator NlpD, contain LysM domain [Algoriphagus locisalis]|uniref:Murein DD-endopeptidase MepM and murein hydrolase activator NlpD, contain LysM domain n=1 Tax=Algoriphagus locisalis TaxID=305507 RepID=A0A1I7CQ49_9BACT|nr:peptidoglycan DD-metalloendopeptidase family protein [Algoriphagus locisalis]SFU01576.1 Murein DD-endopeptidase MepM and murein hydrolase activator NlpD, contain LysM domain [Algoriphagus locisalis]
MKKIWIGIAALVITIGAASSLQFFDLPFQAEKEAEIVEPPLIDSLANQVFLYGINVTGLNIVEGTVSKNQTLGSILAPFNVPYQIIDQIAKKSKEIFDVRGIAANKKFTVVTPADSSQAAFFIYEPNPAEYVVFNLDSIDIYKAEKPAEYRTKEAGGIIDSNLSADMTGLGVTYDIIDQFADLYGWSIDFGALQKGDKFKVSYEEKVIDGVVVGVSDIKTAFFEHKGTPYYAIPFEQNGEIAFYDQNGDSFKKAFLRDPLKYSRISSRYSLKRFHPVQKRYKAHLGTDYAAPTGTEIRSVGEGTVTDARYTSANGNYVKIKHNGTYTTQYLHMSKIAKGIKPGTRIKQGQVIGYVGSTGLATGPHLCFRFWKNGKQEDWLREKIPPSEPISSANKLAFESTKADYLERLAAIRIPGEPDRLVAETLKPVVPAKSE